MPKPPYFERVPSEAPPSMEQSPSTELGVSLEMARPRRGEIERPDLTDEEKAFLRQILEQAKAAEAEGKLEDALNLYQKVKAEFLAIKAQKEREKRGEAGELKFTVPDALNPFREAFLEGGIPEGDPATQEQKDIEVDLEKVLEADIASYRASGLEDWAAALEAVPGDIRLTPEKRQIIEQEIKDGAIPIFMPGRQVQLATTIEMLQEKFKPIWIKDSQPQTLAKGYMWDHFAALIQRKAAELVEAVSERPYIQFIKPTQKPEACTTKKTLEQQKREFAKINAKRQAAGKALAQVTNPFEYAAFQMRFTEQARDGAGVPLKELAPPDSNTWSRFINLPLFAGGYVPDGDFNPDNRQLGFGEDNAAHPDSRAGFRLSVRVEV